MVRTKQGGSVLAFVVGVILLATLLGGGVYWVSQQSKNKDILPPPTVAPTESRQPEKQPSPSHEEDQRGDQDTTSVPAQLPSDARPVSGELPATGPSEAIASSIAAALLSGVIIAYVRSRRISTSL